jgi:hypothetical protein
MSQRVFIRILKLLLIIVFLIGLAMFTSLSKGISLNTVLTSQLKLFLPIFLLIVFNVYPSGTKPSKAVYWMISLVFVISLYAYFFLEPSRNRDAFFWPIYFSGLHTHAYCVFGSFLMLHAHAVLHGKNVKTSWFLVLLFLLILGYGYGVRTSLFCLIGYVLVISYEKGVLAHIQKPMVKFFLAMIIIISGVLFVDEFNLLSLDGFSSGRLSEYLSRIDLIKNRGWLENAFGSGAGYDLMYSDTWWWEEKGSHNDYLTILIEFGLVYLMVFVFFLWRLFHVIRANHFTTAIFVAYLLSSFLSNGYMFRPMAAYVLFLSLININVLFDVRTVLTPERV